VALGLSVWLAIPIGIATLFGVVQAVGQEA
jgi:hypothetical protein